MGDFELDAVLQFILSKGGRVRNHELVTHFKNVLNHPVNKALNRERFKDYVNELASIKLDGGEKILVLKKKYRPLSDNFEGSNFSLSSSSSSHSLVKSSSAAKMAAPKPAWSEPNLKSSIESSVDPGPTSVQTENLDAIRAQSEPPATPTEAKKDHLDGMGMSRMKSDESMKVNLIRSDRVSYPAKPPEPRIHASDSNASLVSVDSHKSTNSSGSGTASVDEEANASVISVRDKIKKLDNMSSVSDLQSVPNFKKAHKTPKQGIYEDDDASHSSGLSYVTLTAEQKEWLVVSSTADYQEMNRLLSKNTSLAKLRDFTNTALHWAAKNGNENVIKLIANKPGVKVNQKSGYTALHLAAIHNHEKILELLVQTFKADPNIRDHSGKKPKHYLNSNSKLQPSYQPCDIVLTQPPEELPIVLRRPCKGSNELLTTRRLGTELNANMDDSFLRSNERKSKRAKAVTSMLFYKSGSAQQLLRSSWNGSGDDIPEDQRFSGGSIESSPNLRRKKTGGGDVELMPPPSNAMMSRRMRRGDRSKSSSRESLKSQKEGQKKNDENENITRSGSDSDMRTHTVV